MKEKLIRFMQGRYGMDALSKTLLYGGLIVMLVSYFFGVTIVYYLSIVVIVYGYFRVFSRNHSARQKENQWYTIQIAKVKSLFKGNSGRKSGSAGANVRVYKCPSCKQKVRVPGGKGRIQITCPKCGVKFIKRT